MIKKYFSFLAFLFIVVALPILLQKSVSADLGPPPSMKFNIIYETTKQIKLVGGEQFECGDSLCTDMRPLGQLGPQGFTCQENHCMSIAYGYLLYHKLILNFSDKARESNVFSTESSDAEFDVKVTDNELVVEETTAIIKKGKFLPFIRFIRALIITLILELLVSLIYLSVNKIPKRVLVSMAIANIISLPSVWFLFPLLNLSLIMTIIISEVFTVLFETFFIYFLHKQIISFKRSLSLNTLNNLVSLFVGGLIYMWMFFYF